MVYFKPLIFKAFLLNWWIFLLCSHLVATEKSSSRIENLLPQMAYSLEIEPALPQDFVMGAFEENPDLLGGIVWGKEEELELLKKNPEKIEHVYFFIKLSGFIIQENPYSFCKEESISLFFEERGFHNIQLSKIFWGQYPVLTCEMVSSEGKKQFMAWVGLNATEGKWALMFHFVYPDSQKEPSSEQLSIWNQFLFQTAPLAKVKDTR